MIYKVIITPPAKRSLDNYIRYTVQILHNKQAAASILEDARKTKNRLSINANIYAICSNPILAEYGYRKIPFEKHDFFMVYRIQDNTAIVDRMFHDLQDYEAVFIEDLRKQDEYA